MKLDELIASIRPLDDDLSIEQKLSILGQVVLTLDDEVERLKADVEKLRADVTRLERLASYGEKERQCTRVT